MAWKHAFQILVVGYNHYDFLNGQGEQVVGTKVHCLRPASTKGHVGDEAFTFSIPDDKIDQFGAPQVGSIYDVQYNQKGKVGHWKLTQPSVPRPAPKP